MRLTPACYDQTTGEWRPTDDAAPVRSEHLTCATFNVWFDDLAFEQRATALLELLAGCDADLIALQEVTPRLLERILASDWVRASYAISDHRGMTVWPYGVLLLTRWTPQRLTLHPLPGYEHSLGGLVAAIDRMRQGSLEQAYCFSLGGHHGFPDRGHGYCLLNPLAAAARYAQQVGFRRVLILDWDIHHGDGTQAIFSGDTSVYCISVHSAVDLYMAKASRLALGTTTAAVEAGHCNIPVLDQRFGDDVIATLGLSGRFYRADESLAAIAEALDAPPWQPDLICVFSGYDAHRDDCGRHVTGWDTADFGWLTRLVLDRAHKAGCPVLSVHGGGYKLPVTVAAANGHIRSLATYRP